MGSRELIERLKIFRTEPPCEENADLRILAALMDEMTGEAPEGTADAIEAEQNKLTGYTFPRSPELQALFAEDWQELERLMARRKAKP
ncbi:hypothetical protein ERD95_20125 [Enterobacteriaceae bacterium ML5]|nr:hypothetical protein ERD95_20125 [Enterobacteriaceae bacterium ML5]